jgi:hypothetical protein
MAPITVPQQNIGETMKTKTVWVVEIVLNDSIVAVGSTKAIALRNCGARALEYLQNAGVGEDRTTGEPWSVETLAEYFGYTATECELDGIGERH